MDEDVDDTGQYDGNNDNVDAGNDAALRRVTRATILSSLTAGDRVMN